MLSNSCLKMGFLKVGIFSWQSMERYIVVLGVASSNICEHFHSLESAILVNSFWAGNERKTQSYSMFSWEGYRWMAGFGGSITGYVRWGCLGEGANEMGNRPNHEPAWLRRHTKEGKNMYVYSKASLVSHKKGGIGNSHEIPTHFQGCGGSLVSRES